MTRAVDLHVTGQVQGVSFRWYAAREATRLALAGWIRNEPDGSVRAHAEGQDDQSTSSSPGAATARPPRASTTSF